MPNASSVLPRVLWVFILAAPQRSWTFSAHFQISVAISLSANYSRYRMLFLNKLTNLTRKLSWNILMWLPEASFIARHALEHWLPCDQTDGRPTSGSISTLRLFNLIWHSCSIFWILLIRGCLCKLNYQIDDCPISNMKYKMSWKFPPFSELSILRVF